MADGAPPPAGTDRPALHALADAVGIIPAYLEQTGKVWRQASDETRIALLAAMGYEAATEQDARRSLESLRESERARVLPPARVVRVGSDDASHVAVCIASPTGQPIHWELELRLEDGRTFRSSGIAPRGAANELVIPLPAPPPLGYHTVRVATGGGDAHAGEQLLIVTPASCLRADELLGERAAAGLIANLYSVRSARNWGAGDFTDLAALLRWAGELGVDFVGVNPLHALRNSGTDVSPYSPVSRLFRSPLYLDVEKVQGFAQSTEARELVASDAFQSGLRRLREAKHLDYGEVMSHKLPVLRILYREFLASTNPEILTGYAKWCAGREPELTDFATFMALQETVGHTASWPDWPDELRTARAPSVAEFRNANDESVGFHRWLQWELDRQLGEAAEQAAASGLRIGLYQDLAIGVSPAGSDAWSFPELFVRDVNVGAPPDPYSATGQDWGLPPMNPRALVENRYRYWITLLRSAFRHAGALRIDHVMGLFRLFWIPQGKSGEHGAYVRYPAEELLGILALESVRHRALVVGEDLGTVPEDVPPALARWGILRSTVMYFEREHDGTFRSSRDYPRQALATANTHDMPSVGSWWLGHDVKLRRETALVDDAQATEEERARQHDREQLLRRLRRDHLLDEHAAPDEHTLTSAVHRFVRRSPSLLVGIALDDLSGEMEPVNVPGVGPDRYPSWQRRMTHSLEELRAVVNAESLGDPASAGTER